MSETTAPPARRVRVGYLVVGLAYLGLALTWALWAGGIAGGLSVAVLVPVVLVVAGVAGLLAMVPGALAGRHGSVVRLGPSDTATTTAATRHDIETETETRPYRTEES